MQNTQTKSSLAASYKNRRRKKNIRNTIIAVVILLLLLVGSIFLYRMGYIQLPWQTDTSAGMSGNARIGMPEGMTEEEYKAAMQKEADTSKVSFQINGKPIFENGKAEGSLAIANPPHNLYDMQVKIYLEDTEKLLYDSGVLPPDYHIDSDVLKVNLPKGTYKANAQLIFTNKGLPVSKTLVGLDITIQN